MFLESLLVCNWNSTFKMSPNGLRLGEGGDSTTNVYTKLTLQIYEKLSNEALTATFAKPLCAPCMSSAHTCCKL
jgi:hypothetical protein